jgi:O-antigen ligase
LAKLYLLSLIVANHVRSRRDIQDVIVALLIGLALQTVVSVLQYIGGFDFTIGTRVVGELRRVSGTLGWPNTLGAYIATSICVLLPLWMYGADRGFRIPIWVFLLAALFPFVWTLSRGAWNALLVGGAVSLLLGWHASLLKGRTTLNRLKAIGLSILVVSPLIAGSIIARLRNPLDTFNTRVQLNQVALNMIRAHPFLGVGINTFVDVMQHYDTTGITRDFPQPVHNVFLLIAAETGLVGLGLFISLLLAAFWEGLQAIKYNDRFLSAVAIGILSGLAVLMVSNLADVHLRTNALYALFWLLIGLVVGVRRMAISSHLAGADG